MTTRKYSSRSQQTTLASGITDTATSCTVVSGSALLGGATVPAGTTFTVVIDPDTALEEIVDVTVVSTNVLTITRGVENNGTGQAHSPGAAVRHMAIGRDFREANLHIEATTGYNDGTGAHTLHGIAAGEGAVVGTDKAQTLTQKTLTAPVITNPSISGAGVDATITFEGATADAHETFLTVAEPTQDNTITLPNTTGTVVIANAAQTLTNKTMGDALNAGGFKITNLATPTLASDAVRKDFADAQVAAAATSAASASTSAASAATSASSALTSANSAATSAANALTSANSAATSASTMNASVVAAAASATAAATSATSAAASATAAATSATSAAASATAASTSATSASASATAAATSATSAAASATASANSASASATSATASASSASAAATSASSALTSQTAAATSATSAAASATAAATSATSAAASATAAATSATSAAASATAAAGYVVPSQTGNAGKFLATDGSAVSWSNSATSFIPTGSTAPTNGIYLPAANTVGIATSGVRGFSINGSREIDLGGNAPAAGTNVAITKFMTGAVTSMGLLLSNTVQSDVTTTARMIRTFVDTQSANFALPELAHIYLQPASTFANVTAGGSVTNQYGVYVSANFTGATNNYGFWSGIASGTNRWNAYMSGTAANYFAGQTTVGSTSLTLGAGSVAQQFGVVSGAAANIAAVIRGAASQTGDLLQVQNSAATELFTIDSAGKVGIGSATPATQLSLGGYGAISASTGNATSYLTHQYLATTADDSWSLANNYLRTDSATGTISSSTVGTSEIQLLSGGAGSTVSAIAFGTSATVNTAPTRRMIIDKSGNVGIGTDPSYVLHVAAATGQIGITSSTGTNFTRLLMQNTGGSFQLGIDNSVGGNYGLGAYSRVLWNDGAHATVLTSNSAERMRITSAGDVGIGTSSPAAKLDVNGSIKSDNLSSVNPVLNSSFNVWQRGTSFTTNLNFAYTADRWQVYNAYVSTISREVTGDTTNLPNIQYCLRYRRNTGQTQTAAQYLSHTFETVNSIPFAGKTVTLSFYARKGANYSPTSSALAVELISGTGTDQNTLSGFSGAVGVILTTRTLTATWQRFTITSASAVPITSTQLAMSFYAEGVGTAGAADYFEITGVQLEVGSVATPYQANQPTYQAELAACQRYYYRNTATGDTYTAFNYGAATSTARTDHYFKFPVTMRTRPTSAGGANLLVADLIGNTFAITSVTLNNYNAEGAFLYTGGATGLTQFRPMSLNANNNTSAYVEFSAEL